MINDVRQIIEIGKRIRKLRTALDISQELLAEKSGLTRVYINRIENGLAPKVSVVSIMAIARALGVHVSNILKEETATETSKAIELIRAALKNEKNSK